MAEYIERKALREAFENATADVVEEYEDGGSDWGFGRQNILEVINSVPAADVAPVRHGRWIGYHEADIGYDEYGVRCSNCDFEVEDHEVDFVMNYCPNCGARMDLEEPNEAE